MVIRTRTTLVLTLLLTFLAGCHSAPIPSHFEPLESLQQRSFGDNSFVTTFHTSVWVDDINDFHRRKPIGSPIYNSVMIHERIHSIRMGNIFTTCWFALHYGFSTDFMWEEEKIGWYFELKYAQRKGILKPAEYTAIVLASYQNLFGHMISYEDALQWVRDVLAGRWEPSLSAAEWAAYSPPAETN